MGWVDEETGESWSEKYARERKEDSEKAKAELAKYRAAKKKPEKDEKSADSRTITYFDRVSDTEKEHKVFSTEFRIDKDGNYWMWKRTEKRQKFLVVNGPLAGQRIQDDNEDYVLYNCASWHRGRLGDKVTRCVLVHRGAFKNG